MAAEQMSLSKSPGPGKQPNRGPPESRRIQNRSPRSSHRACVHDSQVTSTGESPRLLPTRPCSARVATWGEACVTVASSPRRRDVTAGWPSSGGVLVLRPPQRPVRRPPRLSKTLRSASGTGMYYSGSRREPDVGVMAQERDNRDFAFSAPFSGARGAGGVSIGRKRRHAGETSGSSQPVAGTGVETKKAGALASALCVNPWVGGKFALQGSVEGTGFENGDPRVMTPEADFVCSAGKRPKFRWISCQDT